MEIQSRWIKGYEIQVNQWEVNKWQEGTKRELNEKKKTYSSPFLAWYVQWKGEIEFRETKSNFSLDFPAIEQSIFG